MVGSLSTLGTHPCPIRIKEGGVPKVATEGVDMLVKSLLVPGKPLGPSASMASCGHHTLSGSVS